MEQNTAVKMLKARAMARYRTGLEFSVSLERYQREGESSPTRTHVDALLIVRDWLPLIHFTLSTTNAKLKARDSMLRTKIGVCTCQLQRRHRGCNTSGQNEFQKRLTATRDLQGADMYRSRSLSGPARPMGAGMRRPTPHKLP